jgi:hypothetical protein
MPLIDLKFRPGIVRDVTNYTNKGGFFDGDKIRFRSGSAEKIGGWLKYIAQALLGVCRQMFNYTTEFGDNIMWLGTNIKLYQEVGGNLIDTTPIRVTFTSGSSPSSDNCIDTTDTSTTVNVNITGHGCITGAYVTISGVTGDPGGVPDAEINAEHLVTVVDTDNFTFVVTTAATSTTTNGGGTAIDVACQINPGNETTIVGYGWGGGGWGISPWGLGSITPVVTLQRDWWYDSFDNDTVMNIRNGAIYYWEYDATFSSRCVLLSSLVGASDVPDEAMQILVSQNDKHLLAFGCTPYGSSSPTFDPLLIRWADQDDPLDWTPTATNSAGFLRLSNGDSIKRAIRTRQEILVWTQSTLVSLQFLGTTDVFGIQELAGNISLFGPRAISTINNTTYWMGVDKFYFYDGRVNTLPCSIRDYIFKDINYNQYDQIVSGTNEGWNEIWWFYPSAESNVNDRYAIYNFLEQIWYYGNIERTAWLDTPLRQYPQAVGNNYIYDHERGLNDDVAPMESFITSSDFDIASQMGPGEQFMLTRRIIPDVSFNGSTSATPTALMTLRPRNFPGAAYETEADLSVIETTLDQYTNQVFIRARARQMGYRISSDALNVQWQLGTPRLDGRPDGRR